ncbi:hypothetical protein [Nocardioides zhouii]|uniref:Uncharacterized protein n=1 Tax=Nocardioides zhouii TaxID=1168729 RepID=A0A4Q2T0W6_9ACTN|nr:hypothetical protein [Nocardioides zhouii]RYC10554.1 hypothetical protein EUA94_12205 [Nocardioides zhouii]
MNINRHVPNVESSESIEAVLEELRRQGKVVRLKERRGGWAVYVLPKYVNGRPTDDRVAPATLVDLAEKYSLRD